MEKQKKVGFKKWLPALLVIIALAGLAFFIRSNQEPTTLGEKIDEIASEVGEKAEEVKEEIKKGAENLKEKVDDKRGEYRE